MHDPPDDGHGRPDHVHGGSSSPGTAHGPQGHDHTHDATCCRDTILTINGQAIDLSRSPLTIEFCGFTLNVSYSPAKERMTGDTLVERFQDYEIVITGPDRGDLRAGRPPGRLFINGKHIAYDYDARTGDIRCHGLAGTLSSVSEFARYFIRSNPTLRDIGRGHGHH